MLERLNKVKQINHKTKNKNTCFVLFMQYLQMVMFLCAMQKFYQSVNLHWCNFDLCSPYGHKMVL